MLWAAGGSGYGIAPRPVAAQAWTLMNAWASASPHTARCFSVRKAAAGGAPVPARLVKAQLCFSIRQPGLPTHTATAAEGLKACGRLFRRSKICCGAHRCATGRSDPGEALRGVAQPTLADCNRDDMLGAPGRAPRQVSKQLLPDARLQNVFE